VPSKNTLPGKAPVLQASMGETSDGRWHSEGKGRERTISLRRGCQQQQKNEHYIKPCIPGQRLEHGIYEREVTNIFISKVVSDQKVSDVCRCAAGNAVSVSESFSKVDS